MNETIKRIIDAIRARDALVFIESVEEQEKTVAHKSGQKIYVNSS